MAFSLEQNNKFPIRFLELGDSALTLELGEGIDQQLVKRVATLDKCVNEAWRAGELSGIVETVPTYRSLTIIFDPLSCSRQRLKDYVLSLPENMFLTPAPDGRLWILPVCYEDDFAQDLGAVAESAGISTTEVIALHTASTYLVYMLGFLPGFPYMGDLVPQLQMPRLAEPRIRVPAGSVAITGKQTAIYPFESPGGWRLLGRCPVGLFDHRRTDPALLRQGDQVRFRAISRHEFDLISRETSAGSLDLSRFLEKGGCHVR